MMSVLCEIPTAREDKVSIYNAYILNASFYILYDILCIIFTPLLIVSQLIFFPTTFFFRMSTFEVKDILSLDDLKREFDLIGLSELYKQFVSALI